MIDGISYNSMNKNLYFIERYARCGEMPLFLIFYRNRNGSQRHYCVMLCTLKNLRLLLRQRRGFTDPAQYGRIIYSHRGKELNDIVKYMLKARYDFDMDAFAPGESPAF